MVRTQPPLHVAWLRMHRLKEWHKRLVSSLDIQSDVFGLKLMLNALKIFCLLMLNHQYLIDSSCMVSCVYIYCIHIYCTIINLWLFLHSGWLNELTHMWRRWGTKPTLPVPKTGPNLLIKPKQISHLIPWKESWQAFC